MISQYMTINYTYTPAALIVQVGLRLTFGV